MPLSATLDDMSTDPLRDHEAVLLSRSQSLVGADGRSLRREHAAGTMTFIRRGVYVPTSVWAGLPSRDQYLTRMRVVLDTRRGDAVFSHDSAAALWNLPTIGPHKAVHVFATDGRRRNSANGIIWHTAPLPESDVVEIDGVLVTSRVRTMLDLARSSTFMSAVTTLDAGLALAVSEENHAGAAETLRALLLERLDELGRAPGASRARQAVAFSTPLADSPGESVSRVQMYLCRFPLPILQFPVVDRNGRVWHADFAWPRFRLLGEFDGFAKYTRGEYTRGRSIDEVVWAEKKREDLMRATGNGMARWLWDDALRAPRLTRILLDAGLPRS